jgi:hypothetical protein
MFKGKCGQCKNGIHGLLHLKYRATDKMRKQIKLCEICFQKNRIDKKMKKKYIQLPKTYLSYSQCELWKHAPERYKKLYMEDNQLYRLSNSGMDYGKTVATALENEETTGDLLTDAAMLLLPKYDIRDKEIQVETKTKDGWLKIIGRPDSMDSKTKAFYEFKTGKGKWTQNKAQKHPQMIFYAMLIYLAYGVVLNEAQLIWMETEDVLEPYKEGDWLPEDRKSIKPTGLVQTFKVTFTLTDILKTLAETVKIAREIEIAWSMHVKPESIL